MNQNPIMQLRLCGSDGVESFLNKLRAYACTTFVIRKPMRCLAIPDLPVRPNKSTHAPSIVISIQRHSNSPTAWITRLRFEYIMCLRRYANMGTAVVDYYDWIHMRDQQTILICTEVAYSHLLVRMAKFKLAGWFVVLYFSTLKNMYKPGKMGYKLAYKSFCDAALMVKTT